MELPKLSPDMEAVEELISKAPRLVLYIIDEKCTTAKATSLFAYRTITARIL